MTTDDTSQRSPVPNLATLAVLRGLVRPEEDGLWPLLPAYADGLGMLSAYCGHFRAWHWHGRGDGHRVAHCHRPGSPYDRTGYVLVEVGPLTPELRAQVRRTRTRR